MGRSGNKTKQTLRFGIRQKVVLMVVVLSALQVMAVGWYLFTTAKEIVVDHELVDLGDEAQLRGWEIVERINVLKSDLQALRSADDVRAAIGEAPDDVERLTELFEQTCDEWAAYCSVTVTPISASEGQAVRLATPMMARLADVEGTRARVEKEIGVEDRAWQVVVSEIVREKAVVSHSSDDGEMTHERWLPVIWGGITIGVRESAPVADAPQPAMRYYRILIALSLDDQGFSTDPRHLAFLVDESDMSYLIHPVMGTEATLADDDVFVGSVEEEAADAESDDTYRSWLVAAIREREESGEAVVLPETGRQSIPPVSRIALVEQARLAPDYHSYFREGQVTELFVERRDALNAWRDEVVKAHPHEIYPNLVNYRMRELSREFAERQLRVGGLAGQNRTVRVLGGSEESVRRQSAELIQEVNRRLSMKVLDGEAGEVLPEGTEAPVDALPDLEPGAKTVRWNSVIPCHVSDLVCVRLRVDETALQRPAADAATSELAEGGDGRSTGIGAKHYWFLYAVFHDELGASIEGELWPSVRRAAMGMVIAGIIAALVAIWTVKPLLAMIDGARYLSGLSGKRLTANIRKMADQIPVNRSDEVGDIARAARKLFVTITENHRKLAEHQRMIERHKDDLEVQVERAVAELKAKNAELEAAADEKDKFLASVSHELRTPLTIVAGNLQLLLRKDLGEKEKGYATKSLAASKKLEALIRDLLDIQKIIMGGMSLEPAEFDVPELLEEIRDTLQPNARKNNNRLTVSYDGVGAAYGDRVRLNQILTNLVSNSCKFTQDGEVSIEASAWSDDGRDWMKFVVTDSGRGMNEEEQQKVFTRFYTNKKANESGTGLGLDICRRLGELMGGHVYLRESAPGKGSVFVVELPQNMEVGGREKSEDNAAGGSSTKNRRRDFTALDRALRDYPVDTDSPPTVLVIDDEPGIRDLMTQHLVGRGYKVIAAGSGEEGIEVARRKLPDLITLDVMMEGSDGWEVLQTLKGDAVTAEIPVVMVTILDREDKGFALGADDYITKPVDWDQMFSVLGRLAASGGQRKALVVDDDEGARQLFRSVLSKAGWEVAEAGHGGEALEQLKRELPSVIVLDLMMPEMDGFEFLEHFDDRDEWRDIPVIVITAKEMTAAERKKLDECVSRVIQKGTQTAGELLDAIQDWSRRSRISGKNVSAQSD